ncbi:lipopolysaccharide transport periplasmic protein LptA [Thermovibrio ammonificans]|uniref:Lipopolysaccharide transport periplasmic protein LptA n=1 Tax=Thermovibrio ammonificans (strain DSM 15698 / JCM 12110 / HB-1) TaxID=648996 RepID=E8T2M1_THEA1|nr:lipopolysaccharide transport periplasmic protein LptA [Thermovibrio ammonificans]ADU97116.1 lipopolysaccharide transport periplasmic protein LptA [Thermovibrio ammonificans HB-1]
MRKVVFLFLTVLLVSPAVEFAHAGTPLKKIEVNKNLPVVVEAQELIYNDKKRQAVYIGSVVAQHGSTVITGDKLIIYFGPAKTRITKIVVEGNVHVKDPRGEGWCDELIYYPMQEKVVLLGNAKLKQGKNVLIGDKIIAYRDGRVEVVGLKQKVKTVIYPQESRVGNGNSTRP